MRTRIRRLFTQCKVNFLNLINPLGLLRKLQKLLPRQSLVTIYKSFFKPHFEYGDVIFDHAYNKSFPENLENFQ